MNVRVAVLVAFTFKLTEAYPLGRGHKLQLSVPRTFARARRMRRIAVRECNGEFGHFCTASRSPFVLRKEPLLSLLGRYLPCGWLPRYYAELVGSSYRHLFLCSGHSHNRIAVQLSAYAA